ncbi:MAG: hypothetical protein LBM16_03805 [Clostridiales bacterium]|jgi:hypothetical protein|nr:hypothetical protein [Clostridiales bacterium]
MRTHRGLKIVLICLGLLIVIVFVGVRLAEQYVLNKARSVLTEQNLEEFNDFFKELTESGQTEEINEQLKDIDMAQIGEHIKEIDIAQIEEDIKEIPSDDNNVSVSATDVPATITAPKTDTPQQTPPDTVVAATDNPAEITDAIATEKPVSTDSPLNVEFVKNNVSVSDQILAVKLISKIDISYVTGLMKKGLTPEVKSELKKYAMEKYTIGELMQIYELYKKYGHLLIA